MHCLTLPNNVATDTTYDEAVALTREKINDQVVVTKEAMAGSIGSKLSKHPEVLVVNLRLLNIMIEK